MKNGQLRREWLLPLASLWLIPYFRQADHTYHADTYLVLAGMTWLAGCVGLFTAERCKTPAGFTITAQLANPTNIEKS